MIFPEESKSEERKSFLYCVQSVWVDECDIKFVIRTHKLGDILVACGPQVYLLWIPLQLPCAKWKDSDYVS